MKFKRSAQVISLAFMALNISTSARATDTQINEIPRASGFNLAALIGLCSVVYDRSRVMQASQFRFEYERMIFEAAGVGDSAPKDPVAHERIRQMWLSHPEAFTCNSSDFDVSEGSVLKYAISTRNFQFFTTAVELWRLDLNGIDSSDQMTVLDYLDDQVRRNKGTDVERTLVELTRNVRQSGGLTAVEVRSKPMR